MTNVSCYGIDETDVRRCEHSKEVETCTHHEDAGVRCRIPQQDLLANVGFLLVDFFMCTVDIDSKSLN